MNYENKLQQTTSNVSIFSNIEAFENGQRIAQALSKADLVPAAYKNNIPNTMIALEMANRINVSPFMVMQNLDIIKGKPSWSSTFIISALNSCGRFSPLRFKKEGDNIEADNYGFRAYAKDLDTNDILTGPLVNWKMVKAEGWFSKPGSKWKTMPELMFQYRAASFFGRLYAPDILKGMHSIEENTDISKVKDEIKTQKLNELKDLFENNDFNITEDDKLHIQRVIDQKEFATYDKAIKLLKQNIKTN